MRPGREVAQAVELQRRSTSVDAKSFQGSRKAVMDQINDGRPRPSTPPHRRSRAKLASWLTVAALTVSGMLLLGDAPTLARGTSPELSAQGETLTWTLAGKHRLYRVLTRDGSQHFLTSVTSRTFTPPAVPGKTVMYKVRAAYGESGWSNAVRISYSPSGGGTTPEEPEELPVEPPAEELEEAEEAPSEEVPSEGAPEGLTVGLDSGGWGASAFSDISGAVDAVRLTSKHATDAEVGAAASSGVTVASWVFGTSGSIASIDPSGYAAEVVALFKRYGRGGTFWKGREDLGGSAVEVLNEPGNQGFWSDPASYASYVKLLKAVHEALAASFPEAIRPKVLASWDGGEGPSGPFGLGWAALGGLAYCDGVTVHPYGGSQGQDGGALGGHLDVEKARALSGKPVYVTEIGWPTAVGQPSTGDSQQWTEAQQARNITNFIDWARDTEYVPMVIYFNYVDYGTNDSYGIERADRSHKLSYQALAEEL